MSIQDSSSEINRIAEKIITLTKAHKGDPSPYLVSALGIELGSDLKTLKNLTHKGLNDFIQTHLSDRVTLIRLGAHRNVTAVIDAADNPEGFAQLQGPDREQNPRFHYRFWAAFSVPPKNEVRILNPDDLTFYDAPKADVPAGALTISTDLVVAINAEHRNEKIKASIATWLAETGLPEERFRVGKRNQVLPPKGSLLEAMITALDHRQLQSTKLSLDVVSVLLRTPRG
ncbi:MAG: hypothetical protein ACT6Q8_24305 [Niveispirillum sp.]|uniref:hypothetical protein n=1 Tax=Niveispirillum sp. TaxID=1917217 RepID=UPI004036F65A